MDALATVITAVTIGIGNPNIVDNQLHIPGLASPNNSIDTQVRYAEQSAQRLQYLTSKEGNVYHKERFQLECMRKLGYLAGRLCPR